MKLPRFILAAALCFLFMAKAAVAQNLGELKKGFENPPDYGGRSLGEVFAALDVKPYKADSPLLQSGLLGPVTVVRSGGGEASR